MGGCLGNSSTKACTFLTGDALLALTKMSVCFECVIVEHFQFQAFGGFGYLCVATV